jgi:hypothetical protein
VRELGVGVTLAAVATPVPFDARAYLQQLVGQTILTITGNPNTIVAGSSRPHVRREDYLDLVGQSTYGADRVRMM